MVVGPPPQRPVILAIAFLDRQVVDAGDAQPHQALLVELPVLVAVAAEPAAAVVVPLVGEAHRDAVVAERPDLLDQPVVQLLRPLARQERLDRVAALQELGAVSPAAVRRVGERDARRIAGVPGVLGHAGLLRGGLGVERRKRRAAHGCRSLGCGMSWPGGADTSRTPFTDRSRLRNAKCFNGCDQSREWRGKSTTSHRRIRCGDRARNSRAAIPAATPGCSGSPAASRSAMRVASAMWMRARWSGLPSMSGATSVRSPEMPASRSHAICARRFQSAWTVLRFCLCQTLERRDDAGDAFLADLHRPADAGILQQARFDQRAAASDDAGGQCAVVLVRAGDGDIGAGAAADRARSCSPA